MIAAAEGIYFSKAIKNWSLQVMKKVTPLCLVVTILVFLANSNASTADDWPQWLGPRRDSVWRETGIIDHFPEGGLTRKWKVDLAGGYAGPTVANGKVFVHDYLTSGDKTPSPNRRNQLQGKERVLCFDSKTGKQLWKYEYDCAYAISYPAGPRVTPTVDGDRVYTLGAEGDLNCLNADNGKKIWSHNFKKDYGAKTPIWGFCGHPLIDGNQLICLVGGEGSVAVAFDKKTGKELWRALSAKEQGYCPPTMIEAGGKKQLLIFHAEAINSLNPKNGKVYWSHKITPGYGMAITAPRKWKNYLFVGGIYYQALMLKLDANAPKADILWKTARGKGISPVSSTPFLENGYLYGCDFKGEFRCVELDSGKHVWSTFKPTTGKRPANSATAFIVKNGDRFFLLSETGDLIIAKLSPKGYQELSRTRLIEPDYPAPGQGRTVVWSHPAFAEKCVFARNDKQLICVSLAKD